MGWMWLEKYVKYALRFAILAWLHKEDDDWQASGKIKNILNYL